MEYNKDISSQRILIVNDDSINSAGIKVLERLANVLSRDVWVVAPYTEQSGKGYGVSFDVAMRIYPYSQRKFAVAGTPVDNVIVAIHEIMRDRKPDLVLSGINHGDNACGYRSISGTFNAALAAAHLGVRSVAISQCCEKVGDIKFTLAEHFLPGMLRKLVMSDWRADHVININFPDASVGDITGIKITNPSEHRVKWTAHPLHNPHGEKYAWVTAVHDVLNMKQNSEWHLLQQRNAITVTPVKIQQTCDDDVSQDLVDIFTKNV